MRYLYGLIGGKLTHSFSPQIHRIILNAINKQGDYQLFEIKKEDLQLTLNELKAKHAKGVNITIPYKTDLMQYMDNITTEARKIGAINTIAFENGLLNGYNTDYQGFGASLRKEKISIQGKKAVILGTGGASKAVVQYLIDNGISDLVYVSRDPEKIEKKELKIINYEALEKLAGDLIINCTPCGMYPKVTSSPINKDVLKQYSTAIDLIYNPEKTLFLEDAEEMGLKIMNGLYMLVAQAVAAQEIWQKIKIEETKIDEIYHKIRKIFYV